MLRLLTVVVLISCHAFTPNHSIIPVRTVEQKNLESMCTSALHFRRSARSLQIGYVSMCTKCFTIAALVSLAVAFVGCGSPAPQFRRYETYALKMQDAKDVKFSPEQRDDIDVTLAAFFGTPDQPVIPTLADVDTTLLLNEQLLKMSAGKVGSDELNRPEGLYREHCAHCHGVTGDGNGPTAAFLNPYPRDYRKGWFKFKSTKVGTKPTHDDLKKILLDGIPGTAMPSFKLLTDQEVESLTQYVIYLSIRGETERKLLEATGDLDEGARLISVPGEKASAEEKAVAAEQLDVVKSIVTEVVDSWITAPASLESASVSARPEMSEEELAESQKRGRELYYGAIANCAKCHGDSALGDGQLTDYDEWTKEFMSSSDPTYINKFVDVGLPEPRNIRPRNLRQGVYRGGMRPIDIFWRIRNGIEGSPMPAASIKNEDDPNSKGLTENDIWDIVNYVQSLPYESLSDPRYADPVNIRERM